MPANRRNIELQISSSVVKKGELIPWLQSWRCFILAQTHIYVLCTLLFCVVPLVKGNYSLSLSAWRTQEKGQATLVYLFLFVCVSQVTVQYGAFTLTSKHDLWCHNENCHSLCPCGITVFCNLAASLLTLKLELVNFIFCVGCVFKYHIMGKSE